MEQKMIFHPDLIETMKDIALDSIISRVLFKDEKTDVTLFGFAFGQGLSEHSSSYSAIVQVLEGEAEIIMGSESIELNPGSWLFIPPNLPHSLSARSRFIMLLSLIK